MLPLGAHRPFCGRFNFTLLNLSFVLAVFVTLWGPMVLRTENMSKNRISYFDFISSLQAQKNVKYYKIFNYKTFQLHLQNITTVAKVCFLRRPPSPFHEVPKILGCTVQIRMIFTALGSLLIE